MNARNTIELVAVALMIMASGSAWSQGGTGASAASSTASSASSSAPMVSDKAANKALAKSVRATLMGNKTIDASNISVRAKGGAVTLYGVVPDATQIDRAASIAQGVQGVTSVTNKLTIKRVLNQ